MKRYWFVLFATVSIALIGSVHAEEPQKVTVCQLQADPPSYNHKLIEVQAFVSWGFEDFTLFDPTCFIYPVIWLEYGGTTKSNTIYCCGPTAGQSRPKELVIEDISIPLVSDDLFRKLDQRIHLKGSRDNGPLTRATLVGRFFAGKKETYPRGGSAWTGFGHFGCCTLLAIQQVKDVNLEERPGLDPYSLPEPLIAGFHPTAYRFLTPDDVSKYILESQRKAESGLRPWAFHDPLWVATDLVQTDLHGKTVDPSSLKETHRAHRTIEYELRLPEDRKKYTITVSRPYWLSFYARDPNRVAWVVMYAICEKLSTTHPKK